MINQLPVPRCCVGPIRRTSLVGWGSNAPGGGDVGTEVFRFKTFILSGVQLFRWAPGPYAQGGPAPTGTSAS